MIHPKKLRKLQKRPKFPWGAKLEAFTVTQYDIFRFFSFSTTFVATTLHWCASDTCCHVVQEIDFCPRIGVRRVPLLWLCEAALFLPHHAEGFAFRKAWKHTTKLERRFDFCDVYSAVDDSELCIKHVDEALTFETQKPLLSKSTLSRAEDFLGKYGEAKAQLPKVRSRVERGVTWSDEDFFHLGWAVVESPCPLILSCWQF
jgi:hypothetical protein